MFCLHCNSDLLAVDVLWWTVPDSCSAFLARLGGSAGQRVGVLWALQGFDVT